jgi:UDP-N-acetylmuramoyl-tripeptide--D-alanyl-D-alanine ligase
MATLGLAEIAGATHGDLLLGNGPPPEGAQRTIDGYSIDSRTLQPGDLFFAIVGPRFDGHRFVADALARGAAAAVVARDATGTWQDAPALVRVGDTTRALQDLGAHVRRSRDLKVVGITGSAGKTTTKEMTAAVFGVRYRTFKSEGNLNNAFGLPLTLLRMPDDCDAAVLEMGMSYSGEIERLTGIADPDVGMILNVLRVHLENFASLDDIARAKGELFRAMRRDAIAVYNADDPSAARLGRDFPGRSIAYGIEAKRAEVRAEAITPKGLDATHFVLRHGDDSAPVRLALPGRHNVANALAASAAGFAIGLRAEEIAGGLQAAAPAPMRGALHRLPGGIQLFDDSYNSNPAAMEMAIELLRGATPRGRRILVSGDMLELGQYERRAHSVLGEQVAAAGIELFVAVGPLSQRAADAARAGGVETHHFASSAAAAPFVVSTARDGDLVLVKGSRGMKMERVVEALTSAAGRDADGDSR